MPERETVFYTPGADILWPTDLWADNPETGGADQVRVSRRFERGWYVDDWFRPAFGPGLPQDPAVPASSLHLASGSVLLTPFLLSPVGAVARVPYHLGTVTLHRNGVLVGSRDCSAARFAVPPERATYVAEAAVRHRPVWSSFETEVRATWTFESATPTTPRASPLPLLVVRATGAVDLDGAAPAGIPYLLHLRVERQHPDPAPMSGLELEVSHDEGATWRRAPVLRVGDHGVAIVQHPGRAGFVSLRTRAADAVGNRVEQTVIRAYRTR